MMINPFDSMNAGFTLAEMTEAINHLPNRYSRIGTLGLFSDVALHSNVAIIELKKNVLSILPTRPWGSPGTTGKEGERELKSLIVPHTPWEDTVMASDVIGVRRFGSDNTLETVQDKVLEKLQQARDIFDITDEYRKVKALQGIVVDADGSSQLFNSYSFFNITKKTIDFKLGTTTENVPSHVRDLKRYMEDNLMGETMTGVRVFVGPTFYDRFVNHVSVKEIFLNWAGAQARLGTDLRSGFELEGVVFEEYRGMVPKPDGSGAIQFIPDSQGIAVPIGTRNTFKRFVAPADDYLDTVKTLGQAYYARQETMPGNRGIQLFAQSNTLPICCCPGRGTGNRDAVATVRTGLKPYMPRIRSRHAQKVPETLQEPWRQNRWSGLQSFLPPPCLGPRTGKAVRKPRAPPSARPSSSLPASSPSSRPPPASSPSSRPPPPS
ncbi:MAG: major capsid protein, partial [Deltaproteobacteria bacterium]|nr:major capsid protein [Deltaproteobacteria bacterium]